LNLINISFLTGVLKKLLVFPSIILEDAKKLFCKQEIKETLGSSRNKFIMLNVEIAKKS